MKPWRGVAEVVDVRGFDFQTSQHSEAHQLRGDRPLRSVEEPAYTIRGGTPHALVSGLTFTDDAVFSDVNGRRFDEDELLVLQSFREYEVVGGTKKTMRQQIGNAVPPRLAEHIAEEL